MWFLGSLGVLLGGLEFGGPAILGPPGARSHGFHIFRACLHQNQRPKPKFLSPGCTRPQSLGCQIFEEGPELTQPFVHDGDRPEQTHGQMCVEPRAVVYMCS